jgi:hypothetical protein
MTTTLDPPRPPRDDGEAKLLGLLGSPSRKAFMKAWVVMELYRMAGRPICEANDFLLRRWLRWRYLSHRLRHPLMSSNRARTRITSYEGDGETVFRHAAGCEVLFFYSSGEGRSGAPVRAPHEASRPRFRSRACCARARSEPLAPIVRPRCGLT